MDSFVNFILKNKFVILGAFLGIVLAILFLTIGFWKTILILVFAAAGALLGVSRVRAKIVEFFVKLFNNNN